MSMIERVYRLELNHQIFFLSDLDGSFNQQAMLIK